MIEWASVITGLVTGLVTGALTCWFFYWLSGRDLKHEADDLRHLNILIIRALVQAGLAEVNYDASGRPTGLVYKFQPNGGVKLSGSAIVDVGHNPQ